MKNLTDLTNRLDALERSPQTRKQMALASGDLSTLTDEELIDTIRELIKPITSSLTPDEIEQTIAEYAARTMSDEDARALANGDLEKVSDEGACIHLARALKFASR